MKRLAIYNLLFGKVTLGILLSALVLFSAPFLAHAVVDFSVSVKSKTTTTAVITIKNDVQSSVNNEGGYRDMIEFTTSVIRDSDGISVLRATTRSAGKESKDVSFTGLVQNTAYTVQVIGENITTRDKTTKTVPLKTAGTIPTNTTTALPIEFVQSLTTVAPNTITVTVRNKSTKTFNVKVTAKDTTGGGPIERSTSIAGGADAKLFFNQDIISGKTYNLVMTGTQQGVTTTYQSVSYAGIVVPTATTTGGGGGGTATGGVGAGGITTPNPATGTTGASATCNDGKDNSDPLNGKADYYGVDIDNDGKLDLEPDPSCISLEGAEGSDEPAGQLLSCYNYCTFSDVLKTINNFITFLITTLFVPTIVLLFMLAGFKYLAAQGNPTKVANLKKMLMNIVIGMILILCSWLIVKVLLTTIVRDDDSALQFLE